MRAALALLLLALPASARELTLPEAYRLAAARSEELSQRKHAVEELDERARELVGNVRPRLALTGSQMWQDTPGAAGSAASSFAQTSRPQAAVTLHQPLFSGLREFLALKAARAQGAAARLRLERAQELLREDVAAAYAGLLSLHLEMRSRQSLIDLTEDRVKELRARERIGRTRESEVLAAQSQQAQAVSDLEAARGRERTAQAVLRFLTGLDEDLFPADLPAPAPEIIDPFLARARRRADVEARLQEVEAARATVSVYRRQAWPSVSFDGNYYLKRPTGFSEHIRWDATLSASLPLYSGGATSAQAGQARARLESARDEASLALRAAERDVRQAHAALDSALSVAAALERALTLADANAKAQTADYRLGLVTNLDVLSALNTALETRLRRDRARLDSALARARLEVAAGGPR